MKNKIQSRPRTTFPTFRLEVLSFRQNGLSEDTRWEYHSMQNDETEAKRIMDESDSFMRMMICEESGRSTVGQNYSTIDFAS